jgi:hypothetical protein
VERDKISPGKIVTPTGIEISTALHGLMRQTSQ